MKKAIIITVISLIVLLLVVFGAYYVLNKKDISQMNDDEFLEYNLKQTELKRTIGAEQVISSTTSGLRPYSQENYDILKQIKPSCTGKVLLGETVRAATFYTENREIGTLWTAKDNRMICVVSRMKQTE